MKSIIQTPTPSLEKSLDFYDKLGFKCIAEEKSVIVTDGKALIEINPDRFARAGVKLFKDDWTDEVQELEKVTAITKVENGYLLGDPSNVWIYLEEEELDFSFAPAEKSFSVLGNYMGISMETTDMSRSLAIWSLLGFEQTMGSAEQGWVAYADDEGFTLSFMKPLSCPHLFFSPGLTYFNGGKNLPVISKIRELDIPITEEITYFNKEGTVDNVIIRDPGGLGYFVFND